MATNKYKVATYPYRLYVPFHKHQALPSTRKVKSAAFDNFLRNLFSTKQITQGTIKNLDTWHSILTDVEEQSSISDYCSMKALIQEMRAFKITLGTIGLARSILLSLWSAASKQKGIHSTETKKELNHTYSNQGPLNLDAFWRLYVAQVEPKFDEDPATMAKVDKQESTKQLTSTNLDQTPTNLDTFWRLSVGQDELMLDEEPV